MDSQSSSPKRVRSIYNSRNGQCTHLTTTRFFTTDYKCGVCYQTGKFGWLYRCTQDRELMLDHTMVRDAPSTMDQIPCLPFQIPEVRKRGPAARRDKLSLLDEIAPEDLDQYTASQLAQILKQRGQVIDAVNRLAAPTKSVSKIKSLEIQDSSGLPKLSDVSRKDSNRVNKPWLPDYKLECQFKCCHRCRPTLGDRAFLSMNGILNDDIPATAITGFGFHQNQARPVADARLVAGIGLRHGCIVGSSILSSSTSKSSSSSSSSSPIASPIESSRPSSRANSSGLDIHQALDSVASSIGLGTSSTTTSPSFSRHHRQTSAIPLPISPTTPLPIDAPVKATQPGSTTQTSSRPTTATSQSSLYLYSQPSQSNSRISLPLPSESASSTPVANHDRAETPMQAKEESSGAFGKDPLEVSDGVAVTEEAVGWRVADVVTQI